MSEPKHLDFLLFVRLPRCRGGTGWRGWDGPPPPDVVDAPFLQSRYQQKNRDDDVNEAHLAFSTPFRLGLLLLLQLSLLLNHPKQSIAPSLQLLRRPTLEEPIEPEDWKFRDIFLDPL